jgi:hypothetical protein
MSPADARTAANKIANDTDSDVIFYNGDIEEPWDSNLMNACENSSPRRKNVLLLIVTLGGDPHGAYRMARCLQSLYDEFTAFVPGQCKSAGTLLVAGAHELVVADQGELGPLDIQMRKADELWAMNSGLTVMEAINTLETHAYDMFQTYFLQIMARSGGRIGFRTATQVASEVVVGLMRPLYAQIDPMMLGEASRAMQIADDYARRLSRYSRNLHEDQLGKLVAAFSSHGFVIDRAEAERFFVNVRAPSDAEHKLETALRAAGKIEFDASGENPITFISDPAPTKKGNRSNGTKNGRSGDASKARKARPTARRTKARTDGRG